MYESYFHLKERPFASVPRTDHYFPAATIEGSRSTLARCVDRAEGPAIVVGPPGSGKTLLCRLLAEHFQGVFHVAVLSSGRVATRRALLQAILYELGQPYRGLDEAELRLALIDRAMLGAHCGRGIVLLADEGQNSILAAEEGLADHNTLDKIREARGTLILAMQSYSSALPALKGRRDLAETIFTNLNNHVIGAIRDETGREMAANIFGKEWQTEKSHSYGSKDSAVTVKRELRHVFHTGIFTRLPQFKCIVFHVAGRWAQGYIPPLSDDGKRVAFRFRLRRLSLFTLR